MLSVIYTLVRRLQFISQGSSILGSFQALEGRKIGVGERTELLSLSLAAKLDPIKPTLKNGVWSLPWVSGWGRPGQGTMFRYLLARRPGPCRQVGMSSTHTMDRNSTEHFLKTGMGSHILHF